MSECTMLLPSQMFYKVTEDTKWECATMRGHHTLKHIFKKTDRNIC